MQYAAYIDKPISMFLSDATFARWDFERWQDLDLPERPINFVCKDNGVEVLCDSNERVRACFFSRAYCGKHTSGDIAEMLSSKRHEVQRRLGEPQRSGEESDHCGLGRTGRWDRFDIGSVFVHVEYSVGTDDVAMVTLMRRDAAP